MSCDSGLQINKTKKHSSSTNPIKHCEDFHDKHYNELTTSPICMKICTLRIS